MKDNTQVSDAAAMTQPAEDPDPGEGTSRDTIHKDSTGKTSDQQADNLSSQRVFKKSSPNSKLTLYLSTRDLVVAAGRIDRLQGVLLIDPDFVEDRKVYGQITLTFRYGREDEEVMGLKFCNEAVMCLAQLYPPVMVPICSAIAASCGSSMAATVSTATASGTSGTGGGNVDLLQAAGCSTWGAMRMPDFVSPLQEALLKRLGPNAYPFTMDITPLAPPSVQLVPAKEYSGAPIGTSYDVRAYIADRSDEKFNRRTTVRMGIRVVQRAFAPPSPYDYNPNSTSTSNRSAKQHKITLYGCRSAPLDSTKLFPASQTASATEASSGPSRDPCGSSGKVKSKSATASLEVSRCVEDDADIKDDKEDDSSEDSSSPNRLIMERNRATVGLTEGTTLVIGSSLITKVELVDGSNIVVNCVRVGGDACGALPDYSKSSEDNVSKYADDDDIEAVKDDDRDRLAVPGTSASCKTADEDILPCPESEQMEQMRSMCSSKRPSLAVFIAEIPRPRATVEKPFLLSDGKVQLDGILNKAVYHHGEEVKIAVQIRNNSSKTIRRIKVFIVQHVDVCMFSKGKFKNVVALVNAKDDCPIGPKNCLERTYSLIPVKGATKNWIALEDSYTKAGTSLASSVSSSTNRPEERNVFAIYVSYYVKVKLMVSVLGGVVALKLPFTLMHTCSDFDPNSTLTRVVMPPQHLTLDLCAWHQTVPRVPTANDPSSVT